jgi:hypothetical protein
MNAILSPHAGRTIRTEAGDWRPFSEADRLTDKLKSALAVEARRLYDDKVAQETRIGQIWQEARDTEQRIAEADAKLARAIRADAADSLDGSAVRAATTERDRVRADAMDPAVWRRRLDAARERLVTATAEHVAHLDAHAVTLVQELRQDAERVAAAYAAAQMKARKLLAGPEQEHNEITRTLVTLLGRTRGIHPADIPSQRFNELPYPSEAFAALAVPAPELTTD